MAFGFIWLLVGPDLWWRWRRFAVTTVGIALLFALTLLLTGYSEGFALELDRTTLTRNLGILEREGLVAVGPGKNGRTKTVALTADGRSRLRSATPLWREAQERVLGRFGRRRWSALRAAVTSLPGRKS